MGIEADVQAGIDEAFIGDLADVGFAITYQAPAKGYEPTTGTVTNTNPEIPSKALIPGRTIEETDGEAMRVSTLEMIIMRNWITGAEPEIDGIIVVATGVYTGKYIIDREPESTVAHWELRLRQ